MRQACFRVLLMAMVSGFVLGTHSTGSELCQQVQQKPSAGADIDGKPSTVIKVNTPLVVVDVVAVDHKNQPVAGLKQDDFTVLEDGKEQRIRVFSFQDSRLSSQQPPPGISNKPPLPPNVVTNIPRSPGVGPLSVLLLDGINTRMDNQVYLKQQVLEFLKGLPPGQRVAVYFLGVDLQLLQDFSSDPAVLKNVISNLKDFRSPLMENAAGGPERFWFEGMPLPANVKRHVLEFQQETESNEVDQRVAITITALNSLARALAGYPERKNLIWVSETFPFDIVPRKVPNGESAARASRNYGQILAKTTNLLTDAHIAVYPIDARALVNSYVFSANVQYDIRGDSIAGLSKAGQLGRALEDTSEELSAAHATMEEFAKDTGGRAFFNRNDLGNAIRRSTEDGAAYYTLGYYPENKSWDGRFRKIRVNARRSGLTLRYRLGYFALDPESYAKESSEHRNAEFSAALSPGIPASTALPFAAGIVPPSIKTTQRTTINFAVDARFLSFSDEPDGTKKAAIECAVRVFSAKNPGEPLKTEGVNIAANLPAASYARVIHTGLPCRITLDLPAGDYLLSLGVRDSTTGILGTANTQIAIPSTPSEKMD